MTARNDTYCILLVEGSRHDRQAFHRAVKKGFRECEIIDCSLAGEAVSLLCGRGARFDLVVTELTLPDNTGLGLYREVKGINGCPPFIALSDASSSQMVAEALEEGMYAYLERDSDLYPAVLPIMLKNVLLRFRDKAGHARQNEHHGREGGENKRTEQVNRLLVSAFEHTTESVFILDSEGMVQYLNPAAEHALEVPRRELPGEPYEQYVSDGFSLKRLGGKPWRGQVKRTGADGGIRELEVIVSPVEDEAGTITNYTVIEHDVTEEKVLQRALERKRRTEALGMLAGGIAHDFINILQPIIINAELVCDSLPADAPEREYLSQIMEAARIGKEVTNQIKLFGSRKEHAFKPVSIEAVTRDAVRAVSRSLPPHIILRQKIAPTEALVRIDPPQFYQFLTNLGLNAVQAMENSPEGTLTITLAEVRVNDASPAFVSVLNPGEYVKLTVKDTGCGMSPEIIDQIFDPLFTTKKSNKGTGLGLGVVHTVVKNAGGSIIVLSKPGKGSTFEVFFPKLAGGPDAQAAETLHGGSVRKGRILLVDDNTLELKSIHQMLIRLGYRVASTHDSLRALDLFRKTPEAFDLLITDQLMPSMNGDEMASEMLGMRKDLPVILCSGSEEAIREVKKRHDDFSVYLSKPFTSRILADAIDLALGRNDLHFTKTVL